jgi:hypothetical protein
VVRNGGPELDRCNAVGAGAHDPLPQYHEIAAEARMSEPQDDDICCDGVIYRNASAEDFFREVFPDRNRELEEYARALPKPPKPPRPRKPTLTSVAKQASKAAIAVARYEVKPDGTVVVVTGALESSTEPNPWLADLNKAKQ